MRIIKKYANRRLYDMSARCYITLNEVKKLVLEQEAFQVIDAQTNNDITHNILLQIITEQQESNQTPLFSLELLHNFIRFSHEQSQTVFNQYVDQAMDFFSQQQAFLKQAWTRSTEPKKTASKKPSANKPTKKNKRNKSTT